MNHSKMKRRIFFGFIAILLGIPIIVMFWNPGAGAFLLLIGAMSAFRAVRFLSHDGDERYDHFRKMDKAGRTILVQIVDDFGRTVSPLEVDRRIKEARSKAGPRDMVVPVKFKINKE